MTGGLPLRWGRRYVMVRPDHFRIDYAINPYMDTSDQPDPHRALAQWVDLVTTIERVGGTVEVVPQRPDAPDMVYAMNLGLGGRPPRRPRPRRDVAHAVRRAPDGDAVGPAVVRAQRPLHGVRRSGGGRRPPRGRRRVRLRRRAGGRVRPAHRGARAQAPGRRARGAGTRGPDHPSGDVPPRPGLLPARRPPRAGRARRVRRRVGGGPARAGGRSRWCSPTTRR